MVHFFFMCLTFFEVFLLGLVLGRGDKWENFDLIFFPTFKTWKRLLTTN